jgi:hypothetical protein
MTDLSVIFCEHFMKICEVFSIIRAKNEIQKE